MNKMFIILGILICVMIGVVLKSNSDRKAREEALAQQTQKYNQKMSQLEAENQARLAQEVEDKAPKEQTKLNEEKSKADLSIAIASAAVKSQLFDPDSAKFQNQKGNCGEVNSKNKFGGYVGYSRYVFLASDNMVAIESNSSDSIWSTSVMNDLWSRHCN